jgi:hypothetical protein
LRSNIPKYPFTSAKISEYFVRENGDKISMQRTEITMKTMMKLSGKD